MALVLCAPGLGKRRDHPMGSAGRPMVTREVQAMETTDRPVKGTGGLIKRLNLSRILECLQQEGPLSRVEISQRTGISLPTVSHLVAELCERSPAI